jgi:NADH-quinone oxidoreductase subunit N
VVNATGRADLAAFRGLARRSPLLAVALSASLLSMAGVPPLSGAFAKFQVFSALLDAGALQPWRWALAGVGALSVVLAFAYYLPVLREILAENESGAPPFQVARPLRLAIVLALAGVVILGIFPGPVTDAARAILAP